MLPSIILYINHRIKLQDGVKLSECGVQDGCSISLIMLPPFELYIQGTDQRMHTVVVPSSESEVFLEAYMLAYLHVIMFIG